MNYAAPLPFPTSRTAAPRARPADEALSFGKVFTDHMFLMEYSEDRGWHDGRIAPYAPLSLDPATMVLHYAQAVFDGLKAFRRADDGIQIFRPDMHAARLNRSCKALCIPELDPALVQRSWEALVGIDHQWVPARPGTALYIRPTIIATDVQLGVHPASTYLYYVILSPVGAYYKTGMRPVSILATDTHVRAVPGGLGAAKTAANYAASLYAAREAEEAGFTQVLWLDGVEHKYIDEVGTMNIMVRIGDEVITPTLASGTILAGVTRDSVLALLRDWNVRVTERPISIDEVLAAHRAGTLREMWGTGTAAVISPVGQLGYREERITVGNGETGDLTQRLYDAVVGIQYGTAPDPHGWTVPVHVPAAS